MLTEREQEVVASFRKWVRAFKADDKGTMRQVESEWFNEPVLYVPWRYRKGSF